MIAVSIYSNIAVANCHVCSQELQEKLCTGDRQAAVLKSVQTQHKLMLQHLDDACAVLEVLRAQVVEAACDDPASAILPHLVMPLIKDRLEAKALDPQVRRRTSRSMFVTCCPCVCTILLQLPSHPTPLSGFLLPRLNNEPLPPPLSTSSSVLPLPLPHNRAV